MARVNVYFPDELIERARTAELNVSELAQQAVAQELNRVEMRAWLESVTALPPSGLTHEQALQALDEARAEYDW